MMSSCTFFLSMNQDKMFTWIWYVTLEVAAISTYMALLLLITVFKTCHCKKKKDKNPNYNKVVDENSLSVIGNENKARKAVKIDETLMNFELSKKLTPRITKRRQYLDGDITDEDIDNMKTSRRKGTEV